MHEMFLRKSFANSVFENQVLCLMLVWRHTGTLNIGDSWMDLKRFWSFLRLCAKLACRYIGAFFLKKDCQILSRKLRISMSILMPYYPCFKSQSCCLIGFALCHFFHLFIHLSIQWRFWLSFFSEILEPNCHSHFRAIPLLLRWSKASQSLPGLKWLCPLLSVQSPQLNSWGHLVKT